MERTKDYFDSMKKDMQYIGSNAGWYSIQEILDKKAPGTKAEKVAAYEGYADTSDIDIYKYTVNGNIRYAAELSYRTDIDDYCIETHIFLRLPLEKDIIMLQEICNIEFKLNAKRLEPEFDCWECGCKTHWLDIPGDIKSKINGLKESYCGC